MAMLLPSRKKQIYGYGEKGQDGENTREREGGKRGEGRKKDGGYVKGKRSRRNPFLR